jgi:hypothetical protein
MDAYYSSDLTDGQWQLIDCRQLNDPPRQRFFIVTHQCEHIGVRLTSKAATPESQVESTFRLILLRSPTAKERERFAIYAGLHGLVNACHVSLNTNEFVYVD